MAAEIPTCEPSQIVAGDTVQWTKSLCDYTPGDGWTLKYRLVGGNVTSTVTADTSTYPGLYFLTFAATVTAAVVTETPMRLIGWVESGSERHTVYDAVVGVLPNAAVATPANLLTHAERTLAVIEAAIEGNTSSAIQSYSIGGRSVSKYSPADLMRLRGQYAYEVKLQRNGGAVLTATMAFHASR